MLRTPVFLVILFAILGLNVEGYILRNIKPQISVSQLALFPSWLKQSSTSKDREVERSSNKAKIIELAANTENGIAAKPEIKDKIAELVKSLESLNPTKKTSDSPLLNGTWSLVYTTNEGSSAGKVGPFVGKVVQEIDYKKAFYTNNVKLFNGAVEATLGATWDVKGPNLWTVKFLNIKFTLFSIVVSSKSLEGTTGTWRTTYLDDNFRILYAIGGKNTVKENVYILAKF